MANKKKILGMLAAAVLILGAVFAACGGGKPNPADDFGAESAEDGGAKQYYAATTDKLRVRSEPDTDAENVITHLAKGEQVELLEIGKMESMDDMDNPWFKVKTAAGTTGWVFSGYLTGIPDMAGGNQEAGAASEGGSAEAVKPAASAAPKSGGADFGDFPADYKIAYITKYTGRDLYGSNTRFNRRFMDRPCRVTIEFSYGNASEFIAILLLKIRNSQDKEVDALRLEAQFHADNVREMSYVRYCKLVDLGSGREVESKYRGDQYSEGEAAGFFLGVIDTFWDPDWDPRKAILPEELRGTWVRKGADSGRDFDSTLIATANQLHWTSSDGRSRIESIFNVDTWTNDPNDPDNKAANRAAEYPAGWLIEFTALEGEDPAITVGEDYNNILFLNAAKDRFTQYGGDVKDI
jgi:hypothetical protein